MNCENFNDQLPEYLDETLSPAEQAAAREHVKNCAACQQALARQEAFAKSIRRAFDRETHPFSLSAATRQNILNVVKQAEPGARTSLSAQTKSAPIVRTRMSALRTRAAFERFRAFCTIFHSKPAWAGLALLCLLLFIFATRMHRHSVELASVQPPTPASRDIYVIDVPIETETHLYHREKNRVVDELVTRITIINASFFENQAPSLKKNISQN